MTALTPADIRRPVEYWPVRAQERRRMVELRRDRRLMLGSLVSLVFENRETVRGMVETILCAGWIDDPKRIADEVELFNVLVPGGDDLRATLFVVPRDGDDMGLLRELHDSLVPHVHLVFGNSSVTAEELGDAKLTPTVHYVRFHIDAAEQAALREGAAEVAVLVDHPRYSMRTELTPTQRAALATDLDDHGSRKPQQRTDRPARHVRNTR
jgi:hypothetical protein